MPGFLWLMGSRSSLSSMTQAGRHYTALTEKKQLILKFPIGFVIIRT